ncbi:aberrant pollen transmission 1 (ISS) [Dorcoceras hygrometricum]|uniref:Aberrant pollen transmission 1 (ISS) n=1 Tax=Dorcoceras hygrometricum TaxID=472368 RepID=A0A2Z7BET7_9LAMI|nr:aberrant pollen transmission 1 (ISS) [Dorcoceras hygrometricum]
MHEQGYQESSIDEAQRLSCADIINHHLVIFRCDDSSDHHKAMVFRHDDSSGHHLATLDLSGATTQPVDRNVPRNSALKGIRFNSTTQPSTKLKMERNHLPKAAKEHTNYGSTVAKIHKHCNNFALHNSDDSSLQTGINRTLKRRRAQRYQSCSKRQRKTTAIDGNRVRMNNTNRGLSGMKIRNIRILKAYLLPVIGLKSEFLLESDPDEKSRRNIGISMGRGGTGLPSPSPPPNHVTTPIPAPIPDSENRGIPIPEPAGMGIPEPIHIPVLFLYII